MGVASLVRLLGARPGEPRGPAYRRLAGALRLLVLDGRLPLHVAVPGERELAAALGVSRTTVAAAYGLLRDEGYLISRHGARSVTALPAGRSVMAPGGTAGPRDDVLDLAYATLPAPEGVLHEAYAAALAALPAHLPGHGYSPVGLPSLRAAVADRYARRGVPTSPDQVLITHGAQHALSLLIRLLTVPGDRVLVDSPTYPHAMDAIREAGCRIVPVPLPDTGWDVDAIEAAVRQTGPRIAYLVPDFHNPTGRCMSDATRSDVVGILRRSRTLLVVDEALVDLGLDVPTPDPVAAHDSGETLITIGSTSKSFWGGLRVGWVRAPVALLDRLATARTSVDLGSPLVEQLAVEVLLADPDRVLVPRRELLRDRRAHLLALVREHLPEWRVEVPPGGLSVWAQLPDPVSTALAAAAVRAGVRVAAGPRFGVHGAFERNLRLPFTLPEQSLAAAIRRLAEVYAAVRTPAPNGVPPRPVIEVA